MPRLVWTLGWVSLLMDISSEMIHGLLPVYLFTVLGASATLIGLIEGIAEATASITKMFSGTLSDWLGRRQLLAAIGYGLSALTKPIFPLASGIGALVIARFLDRIGKGIRGAPRDALITDATPAEIRGAAFGLRQSLDTVGAFVGPLLALGIMAATANSFRTVFWIAVIPAFASFALVAFAVRDVPRAPVSDAAVTAKSAAPFRLASAKQLPGAYWLVVALGMLLTIARISEAFLLLRAQQLGLAVALSPLVLIAMNIVYAAGAYPIGLLGDSFSKRGLLIAGSIVLIASELLLSQANGLALAGAGVILWGLHMALTQGLLAALVADTAPAALRGTAFGLFNLLTGLAMLAAGVVAGRLWDAYSSRVTFLVGAALAGLVCFGLLAIRPNSTHTTRLAH